MPDFHNDPRRPSRRPFGGNNAPAQPGRFLTPEEEQKLQDDLEAKRRAEQIRSEGAIREAEPNITTVKAETKKPFPLAALFLSAICLILALFTIYGSVRLSEYRAKVLAARTEIRELTEERDALEADLNKKDDLLLIEKYAIEYGMVRADRLTPHYISIAGDDVIETYDGEE